LKLSLAGSQNWNTGVISDWGSYAAYWSSSPYNSEANYLSFDSSVINPQGYQVRTLGYSVRCFKN
jgi:uncharacterized protein (TIGR02145 family)